MLESAAQKLTLIFNDRCLQVSLILMFFLASRETKKSQPSSWKSSCKLISFLAQENLSCDDIWMESKNMWSKWSHLDKSALCTFKVQFMVLRLDVYSATWALPTDKRWFIGAKIPIYGVLEFMVDVIARWCLPFVLFSLRWWILC